MMNKAEKKVSEAQAIAEIYTYVTMRIEDENDRMERFNEVICNETDGSLPREWEKEEIEKCKVKIKAFEKINEVLLKQI